MKEHPGASIGEATLESKRVVKVEAEANKQNDGQWHLTGIRKPRKRLELRYKLGKTSKYLLR